MTDALDEGSMLAGEVLGEPAKGGRSGSSWSVPWAGATTRATGQRTALLRREKAEEREEASEDEEDDDMNKCVSLSAVFIFFCSPLIEASFLAWHKANGQQILAAQAVGQKARRDYSIGVRTTTKDRQILYIEGLQKCNSIDDELIADIDLNVVKRNYRKSDAESLEKIGLNKFFSAFVTLPVFEMQKVVDFACAKHEQQLECGLHFEGEEKTRERIAELMQDGGNRQMFEHECIDSEYAGRVYPCLGRTEQWIGACEKEINEYSILRQKVNSKIENVYDSAIRSVKTMKENREQLFTETMRFIRYAEGSKCLAFKKMRICLLQQLVNTCGVETARALNTSLSVGYLTSERSERLQSDFDTFNYPTHPFCDKL